MQIPCGNDNKGTGNGNGNGKGKCRFPAGMTTKCGYFPQSDGGLFARGEEGAVGEGVAAEVGGEVEVGLGAAEG